MGKFINKLKFKLLYKLLNTDSYMMDVDDEKEWLEDLYHENGFKSYVKLRDIIIMKKITIALENNDVQLAYQLNGRRQELLHLLAKAKRYSNDKIDD